MTDNVVTALASVQAAIGGIVKTRGGEGGISYAYRGIDAIAAAAQPLLGKAGVVIVPDTRITKVVDITVNGKPWVDTFVSVEWTIYGPGGVVDQITATTQGIGRDNSDKSYNKAATQAFKNLLLRLLCIGDPQDDADAPQHQNNATDAHSARVVYCPPDDPDEVAARALYDEIAALPDASKLAFKAWKPDHRSASIPALLDPEWRAEIVKWMHEPAVDA